MQSKRYSRSSRLRAHAVFDETRPDRGAATSREEANKKLNLSEDFSFGGRK